MVAVTVRRGVAVFGQSPAKVVLEIPQQAVGRYVGVRRWI